MYRFLSVMLVWASLFLACATLHAYAQDAEPEAPESDAVGEDVFVMPVIIDGEELFNLRGSSALPAAERVEIVQDRIIEQGAELYQWLQDGAHFYICGDANRMAKDVHAALIEVLKTHGNLSQDAAETYLSDLKDQKRYQRDVY